MAVRLLWKACLLLGIVFVLEGLVFFFPGNPDARRRSYLAGWRVKHEHLVGRGHDRIILAGGSNVAFGVDSSQVQKVTQRETINLGLLGGIGLGAMLNEVEDGVRAGDLVVLMPEYEHFYGSIMYGDRDAANLVRYDMLSLRYFSSWGQWKSLVENAHALARDATLGLVDTAKRTLRGGGEARAVPTIYRSDAFNEYGDVVAHLDQAPRPDRVAATSTRAEGAFNEQAIEAIARSAGRLAARGVGFLVFYPPVSARYWAVNSDLVRQVAAHMPEEWTLTTPEEWVFDDRLFYDTAYHLNRAGRELRTKKLVHRLPAATRIATWHR